MDSPVHPVGSIDSLTSTDEKNDNLKPGIRNEIPINSQALTEQTTSQIPGTQSNLFRILNQSFADDLKHKSFKRLCTTPDTIPQFFSVPSKKPVITPKIEPSSQPCCMQDEISVKPRSPQTIPDSSFGFCGLLDGDEETSNNLSSLPKGTPAPDIENIRLIRRPMASNTSLCSAMSADSTLKEVVNHSNRNLFGDVKSVNSVSKPKQESSNCSLKEIESFHQQFVGDLPLLNCPTMCCVEGSNIPNCGQVNTERKPEVSMIYNQNLESGTTAKNIEEDKEPEIANNDIQMTSESTAPTEANCCCCEIDPENNNLKEELLTDIPVPSIPSEAPSAVDDMIKTISIKYLEFIESEWKTRREVWKENLKHVPKEQRKKSLYTYETFRECVASRKIKLQVPFGLPKIRENNGNLVLQDPETPSGAQVSQDKAMKKHSKAHLKTCCDITPECEERTEEICCINKKNEKCSTESSSPALVNQTEVSLSLQKVMSNIIESDGSPAGSSSSIQDVSLEPVDVSAFLKECHDFLEHLKKCPPEKSSAEYKLWLSLLKETGVCCQPTPNASDQDNNQCTEPSAENDCQNISAQENVITQPADTHATTSKKSVCKVASSQNNSKSKAFNKNMSKVGKAPPKLAFGSKLTNGNQKSKQELTSKLKKPVKKVTIGKIQSKDGDNVTSIDDEVDPHANEPLVEIYRGLSRENTISKIKRDADNREEYRAFVNGRVVVCDSIEQKTRLDICCMKLNTTESYPTNLKDLSILPGVKVLPYLKLQDFMNLRLVCKNWNSAVTTCQKFLSTTTFIVEAKPLGALSSLESSRVRWQNLRCSIMPSVNFTTHSYNGRFISSNLRVIPQANRREPLTSTLTTVIFENFNINKQQLVQWIQNCKRLSVIEIRNCNFLKSTTSMNMDKTNRVMERIQKMKFADMNYVRLAEILRFFLPATRRLHTLEIKQGRSDTGKSSTFTARKGAEEDISSILCPTLTRNVKTLRNISFQLISTKNYQLQSRVVDTLGKDCFQLSSLVLRSFFLDSSLPCVKMDSYGSSKCMTSQVRSTLQGSKHLTLLDFPMLAIDFVRSEEGSKLLSPTLVKLGAQLDLPMMDTFKTNVEFPNLTELDLYGPVLEDCQWGHVKQTMKGLTKLVVHCAGIRDSHLQSIIHHLKSLQLLSLENVVDITDFGITGMERSWIERLKMYWPEKIEPSHDQFPRDKIHFIGKSLSTLEGLQTFRMTGEFGLSNVGVLYGFNSKKLTTLELVGSPVNVSNSGMFILGFQCSHLRRLQMTVRHTKANHFGIRDLYESIGVCNLNNFQVELLSCQDLGSEEDSGVPMIDTY